MPTYLDGETKTDRTLGDVDTDITAIKTVTDNLPNAGALTDLAAIKVVTDLLPDAGALSDLALIKAVTDNLPNNGSLADLALIKAVTDLLPDGGALTEIATQVDETELHFHNVERWWGALAGPGEINAIEANVSRPFVATSGNDTWGTAIPIKGTADNPVTATDAQFDGRQLMVVDSDHATAYRMRIIYGAGTSADAITAGQWSEIMFITAPGPFASGVPVDIRSPLLTIGIKLWCQIWNATNASTVSFFWNAHGYP